MLFAPPSCSEYLIGREDAKIIITDKNAINFVLAHGDSLNLRRDLVVVAIGQAYVYYLVFGSSILWFV